MQLITGALPYWQLLQRYRAETPVFRSGIINIRAEALLRDTPHECVRTRVESFIQSARISNYA